MNTTTSNRAGQHELDQLCIDTIATLSMDAVQNAGSGHPGTPMALAPLAYVLYTRLMKHNPADPRWPDRDRFVLSAGHASMLDYAILYLTGYELTLDDIKRLRQLGGPLAGHPEYHHVPGVEATTGPLGQGISMCVGLALGERMLAARFNRDGHRLVDHHTFCIASDGDLMEGVTHEACSLAGHLGLGRLIVFYDDNLISLDGPTSVSFSEDVGRRFEAYGWHVNHLHENLAPDQIEQAAREAMAIEGRPSLIICRTHIAPGSPNKQDTHQAHGSPLGEEEIRLTKQAYGWPPDEHFHVPDEALEQFRTARSRGAELQAGWNQRAHAYRQAFPEQHELFEAFVAQRLPGGFGRDLPSFDPAEKASIATREASGEVIQWAARSVPFLVGGSADLAGSNITNIDDGGDIEAGSYDGRNIHFGVREHGMGAIVNGLNLHYLRAYGATFLIFSDYMKGAIRLSALMRLPAIWVFTHDSIGLGGDGPTHQPVEQLAHLRAVPNLYVIRPTDANETALAWEFALEQTEGPCALALTRQGLPVQPRGAIPDDAVRRGAYVLRESNGGAEPDLILIASGSEVHLAAAAADLLEAEGVATRVVSMPCMERFAEQDDAYRDAVLPPACRARVAVEAASSLGWHRWTGEAGAVIGMETFGASGAGDELFEHFGFTPARVAAEGRATVDRAAEARAASEQAAGRT
jgi:transketolase